MFHAIKMLNNFPVKVGISDTISPTTIITGDIIHCKKVLVYIVDSTVNYMRKTLLAIEISHVPKVPYAWYQAETYKASSTLGA